MKKNKYQYSMYVLCACISTMATYSSAAPLTVSENKSPTKTLQPHPMNSALEKDVSASLSSIDTVNVPSFLTLAQAQQFLIDVSPKLAAERANIDAKKWQRKAVDGVDNIHVFARTTASTYKMQQDVDLTKTKEALAQGINSAQPNMLADLAKLGIQLPPASAIPPMGASFAANLPDTYHYSNSDTSVSAGVGAVLPLYTGGKVEAIENMLDARTIEARAQSHVVTNELYTQLIKYYFDSQLATLFTELSEDALNTIQQTNHMSKRLYETGFISLVEQMEAQTALANAKSNVIKMRNISQLEERALQNLLRAKSSVKPTTPLFISTKPLKELSYYQEIALRNNPYFKVLRAKREQAKQLHGFSDNKYKPNVSLFGYVDVDKKPSWIAGISATWSLTGGIDKSAMMASNRAKIIQADFSKLELKDNLLLLVEKNWHNVHNAQARYKALQSSVNLSAKVLKLRKLGMKEGINTAIEVVQAQTQYLQARTEQAQAVNDYVQSLASLMQSCGTPLEFNSYMKEADKFLSPLYKQADVTEAK